MRRAGAARPSRRAGSRTSGSGRRSPVKGEKTFAAVERLRGELGETKAQLAAMEEERFREIAAQQAGRGDVLLIEPAMRPESVRRLCDAAAQVCGGRCAVFAGADGAYHYAVIHAGRTSADWCKT